MAVYTHISEDTLVSFLAEYNIGTLQEWKGIAEGVENSNFFLRTTIAPYILTIYEKRVNAQELPFFIHLMQHLAGKGFPCPVPIAGNDGITLRTLEGRPAAIVSFLQGKGVQRVQNYHLPELGKALARLHKAAADFPMQRTNDFSLPKWLSMFATMKPEADKVRYGLKDEISRQLGFLQKNWPTSLPEGIIHADAFPDNVFFEGETLSGVIDFYFACNDFLAYDLAIALNAWCFEPKGEFNITKAKLLLSGYNSVRPLEEAERQALPILASGAAMRFLLTRLHDWLNKVEGALVIPKNPLEYWEKLCFHKDLEQVSAYGL